MSNRILSTKAVVLFTSSVLCTTGLVACGGSDGDETGSGGQSGNAGQTVGVGGEGDVAGASGETGRGGSAPSGGASGEGGAAGETSEGGSVSAAGETSEGGSVSAAGETSTGGSVSAAGEMSVGGSVSAAGETSVGGAGGDVSQPPGEFNLGTNLESIEYWSVYVPYADMARMLCSNHPSCWQAPDQDVEVTVNDSGYPTEEACTSTWAPFPSGEYAVSWEGSGTFRSEGDNHFVLGEDGHSGTLTYNADSRATFCVTPPVSALKIQSPASEAEPGHMFRRKFLSRMEPFSTLRMMDLGKTNSNFSVTWAERAWPEDFSSARAHGMPYEDMIRLANESGKDLWVNVPAYADDDYICRMARLFRYGESGAKDDTSECDPAAPGNAPAGSVALDPGITLYVELGNELWNWAFPAKTSLYCMVHGTDDDGTTDACFSTTPTSEYGAAALADSSLPWDETNTWAKASQYIALLGWHMGSVFKTAFADSPDQVVVVMDGQAAWPDEARTKLTFLDAAFSDWRQSVDALGIAPYIHVEEDPPADLDTLFTVLDQALVTNREWISQCVTLADEFGVELLAYEGGQHLVANTDDTSHVYHQVQDDPRMYDLYREYLGGWRDLTGPGTLFCYYTFATGSGSWGDWGALTNGELQPGSQKWDALMSLALSPGDANLDGAVNAADLTIIQGNLGSTGMWWEQGDFNHDGLVDAADVALYEANVR